MTDPDVPEAPEVPDHDYRPQSGSYDRTPPHDAAAERAVLGSMLISPAAIEAVVPIVVGEDFYQPAHEMIYDVMLDLYSRGEPIDPLTVSAVLTEQGLLSRIGGPLTLHALASDVPIAANAPYYAQMIADAAVFRRLTEAGTRIAQRGYTREGDAAQTYEEALSDLMKVGVRSQGEDYVRLAETLPEAIEAIEALGSSTAVSGVPTGFLDLDELTNGLHPGQMIVVAGRPAMGKSTLAVDFCRAAAIRHGLPAVYFSLEMSRSEITRRIISAESKVALNKINSGLLSDQDWTRIAQHMDATMNAPLWIDDSANLTMSQIAAKARRLKVQEDIRLIVIDYLQLMSSGKRVESRQNEVSEFSRQIKLLAKELGVPVVALSQLNRGPEQRTSKRPMLSDLRESGSIEQDADVVILLHREDMYEVESTRPGEADLIIAKHRNGATKDIAVAAQLHYSRLVDLAH